MLDRLQAPPIRFFTPAQARTLGALCDLVTAQRGEPRVPVLEMVDGELQRRQFDGFRYAWMPDDGETWRLVAQGLDEAAAERHAEGFAGLPLDDQRELCSRLADGDGDLAGGAWETIDPSTAWKVVTRGIAAAFYSHPWAWTGDRLRRPSLSARIRTAGRGHERGLEGEEATAHDPGQDAG